MAPPVIDSFEVVYNGELSANFTWVRSASYFVSWELRRADSREGTYSYETGLYHSSSPVVFRGESAGWYKLRGKTCQGDPEAIGPPLPTCETPSDLDGPVKVPDTSLSALSLSGVALHPAFASATLDYMGTAPYSVSQTTVAATLTVGTASVDVGR